MPFFDRILAESPKQPFNRAGLGDCKLVALIQGNSTTWGAKKKTNLDHVRSNRRSIIHRRSRHGKTRGGQSSVIYIYISQSKNDLSVYSLGRPVSFFRLFSQVLGYRILDVPHRCSSPQKKAITHAHETLLHNVNDGICLKLAQRMYDQHNQKNRSSQAPGSQDLRLDGNYRTSP